ncbi:hypothetical protein, partial [Legionella maceachernii]
MVKGSVEACRSDSGIVVLSEAKDLLNRVTVKSREVLRVAQDDGGYCRPDGGVVVLSVVRDLLGGVIAKSWEVL